MPLLCVANLAFNQDMSEQELLGWSNKCLTQCFNADAADKLKKWELTLTPDAFVRLRKTYANGKQEYFSMHLRRLEDLDYWGTVAAGNMVLRAKGDDVIVQTYNDRSGNVDSMATVFSIPVKNMEPERLDSLRNALLYFKKKNL
ncbi:hypothetical protein GCM10023149_35560 [Mucilaginibacter gynuensis]|uniref:Uncharacterized protein n=2 Tax=Mucilaginibacter gynuensis TaxID=1302236 RepID=A0ABP8GVD2_9SPHI